MAPKIQIIFTNTDKIFYPGEVVTGYVKILSNKETKCKGFLTYEGLGFVHLKGLNSRKSELDETYSLKETYYSSRIQIIGMATSNETLTTGEHSFDFQYVLPINVPSSFESKNGYVKHYCEINLELYRSITQKVKCVEYLKVNSILDLSAAGYHHALQTPAIKYADKEIKYLFTKNGKISANVKIGRTAYIPDEDILIDAEIQNTTNRILCTAKAKLVQAVKYKVSHHSLIKHEVIGTVVKKYLVGNTGDYDWSNETLKVPQVPPSHLLGCNIIDIQYSLQFQLYSRSSSSAEVEVNMSLIIGSLSPQENEKSSATLRGAAFDDSVPTYRPEFVPMQFDYSAIEQPSMPFAPNIPNAPPLYPDINPPPYEECLTSK